MGLFNLKKNKRYNYTVRFSEDYTPYGKSTNPKKIKSKFDDFRTTIGNDNGFRNKFRNAINDYKRGTTHPLDKAHEDAVKLMLPVFKKITGEKLWYHG